uniref:Copper transport protein n=1 Tax=Davidia involucrata TaxID=16924 RepID=A0A5B6ZW65_DAVIN
MMHMTLYWGKDVTLLFDSWKSDSWTSYALTLLACFLFSVFYQYMEDRRLKFKAIPRSNPSQPSIDTPLLSKFGPTRWFNPNRLITAVLFGFNSAIGYLLMLAIMSFNGGVFVAVILGLAVGYYLFRTSGDGDDEAAVIVENSCACS